jgi:hypothetical protein
MGTYTKDRNVTLAVRKVHPFFLYEHINNNKQRKEKEAKRKENQQHTISLLIIIVNKRE